MPSPEFSIWACSKLTDLGVHKILVFLSAMSLTCVALGKPSNFSDFSFLICSMSVFMLLVKVGMIVKCLKLSTHSLHTCYFFLPVF